MSGFRKAKAEQAALKIALYGPPGSGKTFTALLLAEGLAARDGKRIAFVDTERGTDFYCKPVRERAVHPEEFDFDAIYTRSLMEVVREVKALDPAQYSVIVIDSITHLWEAARAAYAGKQTKIGTIPMQAWGAIKKPYKELLSILLSSPMHAFILGRQGTEYATDEETDELKSVGLKMKAEGETAYEPHILIRMEAVKPRKTNALATIVAYAEKDRTGILSGRSFANPTFETICGPLLGLLGGTQAQMKSADEFASDDAEAIERDEHAQAAASGELMRTFCARIELADNAAALKKIGDAITPQIKARMLPSDLATVREKYHRRMSAVPDNGKAQDRDIVNESYYGRLNAATPHDPKTWGIVARFNTGEVTASEEHAVADLTQGGKMVSAIADQAGEAATALQRSNARHDSLAMAAQLEKQAVENGDPHIDKLLDAGRAAATNGVAKHRKWENNLSAPDYERLKPHLDALRQAAAAADGERA